jgi:diguanylate cyclase (GGDEF)-like protein
MRYFGRTQSTHWSLGFAQNPYQVSKWILIFADASIMIDQWDSLTGAEDRATVLAALFRETDRVQRMKTPLAILLLAIDEFDPSASPLSVSLSWPSILATPAGDGLLCQVAQRIKRLLRSYDLLGRVGKDELLLALPGCDSFNATMLAERLSLDVFAAPFQFESRQLQLTACCAVASSDGRSPLVVLGEAARALQSARATGPGSITTFSECRQADADPVAFLAQI